ncbi:MAG: RluA family pseudouridine synthase [Planctomycetota bacterium]
MVNERWRHTLGLFEKNRDLTQAHREVALVVDAQYFREPVRGFAMRLDQFLAARLEWRSRSSIQTLVRDGYVWVDLARPEVPEGSGARKRETRPGARMPHGTRVWVEIPEVYRQVLEGETKRELDVLYEDRECLAVDKPANIAVHPSGRHMTDTLIQRVHLHFKEDVEAGRMVPRLCHRLDRETSGIVLVAKHPETHPRIATQFEDRLVDKEYLALVWGEVEEPDGCIDYSIGPALHSAIDLKMCARSDGQPCRTDWRVEERVSGYTLVRCRIHTGRTHQIRVHLAAIGHPVVGDKLYGPDEQLFVRAIEGTLDAEDRARLELDRHALHDHRLEFTTPDGGRRVEVVSPLAPDLAAFLDARR